MSSSNMKVEGDKLSVSDDKKGIIQSPCAFQEGKFSSPPGGDCPAFCPTNSATDRFKIIFKSKDLLRKRNASFF